ncbi:MAG TPA: hypothetical protein VF214_05070 [Edaphobacter sp.]
MQLLNIQGFSYAERDGLVASLITAIHDCGGWVLDRKSLSPTVVEVHIEIHPRSAIDLYAALVASGLQLTRAGHLALTALSTCRRYPTGFGEIVPVRLEVSFIETITLQSLLMTGSALA